MNAVGTSQDATTRGGDADAVPELRQVLGAGALSAGLALRSVEREGVLTHAEALEAARAWDLLDDGASSPAAGGGTVVVLVDGLGLQLLRERKGHAPTLRSWLAQAEDSRHGPVALTCWPSTTAAALTTLGTGAGPGVTGMVGYSVLSPFIDRAARYAGVPCDQDNLCLITWEGRAPDPRTWQDVPTIFQRLERAEGTVRSTRGQSVPLAVTIGPARFAGSGLTEAGLRGTPHLGADRMEDRPALAASALRRGTRLVYLYVGELDHAGHGHGWRSQEWLTQLERLDTTMSQLVRQVPRGTRIVLTADHGMVDTCEELRVDVTDDPLLSRDVVGLAGEPRFSQLYVPGADPDTAQEVAQRWREVLGERALWVGTRDEAEQVLGPVGPRAHSVLGDVLVAMDGAWVVVDPRVHSEQAMAMPGVHGSFTPAETEVPLLVTWA
ncbi:alkaline phosphatase family protein [Actinomyces faecalis]|uniref:alkaline phosphatase family protein n=1 Tax=Actinomyces faecalis TaxID=2722820 RepID=UPI0015557470|nr:nucleotide pyrophosphatase/phosphodiesterase family protein [Actinomyces faecalis]